MTRTTQKIARDIAATERAHREDQAYAARRAMEAEARLDAPLTRREVLEALDTAASEYSGPHGDANRTLLNRIKEALS